MATHQHPRPVGPTTVNAQAPFTPDMVLATRPERPRLFLAPRIPLPWCQTTHTPAPVTVDMLAGYHPDTNRAFIAPKRGLTDSQTTHVQAPITVDMLNGWHPETNRAFTRPKLGLTDSQTTHVPAPITTDMVAGWHPDAPAKIFLGPKLGWVAMELTHVAAPFSHEMVMGARPDQPCVMRYVRWGSSDAPISVVVVVTPEMYVGWHPDSPILGKPKPLGWTTSQTTHVPALITLDMLAGWRPETPRLSRTTKAGLIEVPHVTLLVMTPDMVAGWHPDAPVLGKPKPWGWTVSQTTHTSAPISLEMLRGWQPSTGVLRKPWPWGWISDPSIDGDGGIGIDEDQAVPPIGTALVGRHTRRFVRDLMTFLAVDSVRVREVAPLAAVRSVSTSVTSMAEGTGDEAIPVDVVALAHGLVTGDWTEIAGASPEEYNGTFPVTVSDANHFQYLFLGSPTINPTGTITSTKVTFTRLEAWRLITPITKRSTGDA